MPQGSSPRRRQPRHRTLPSCLPASLPPCTPSLLLFSTRKFPPAGPHPAGDGRQGGDPSAERRDAAAGRRAVRGRQSDGRGRHRLCPGRRPRVLCHAQPGPQQARTAAGSLAVDGGMVPCCCCWPAAAAAAGPVSLLASSLSPTAASHLSLLLLQAGPSSCASSAWEATPPQTLPQPPRSPAAAAAAARAATARARGSRLSSVWRARGPRPRARRPRSSFGPTTCKRGRAWAWRSTQRRVLRGWGGPHSSAPAASAMLLRLCCRCRMPACVAASCCSAAGCG